MGTRTRPKPARLPDKLRQIRFSLGLSQNELINYLGLQDVIAYNKISNYEQATREPALPILLKYARAAGVLSTCSLTTSWIFRRSYPGLRCTEEWTLQRPGVVADQGGKRTLGWRLVNSRKSGSPPPSSTS